MEAVKTNIIGTDNVLTTAIEEGVEAVVCLSTDKAAYPINAMGKSKSLVRRNLALLQNSFSRLSTVFALIHESAPIITIHLSAMVDIASQKIQSSFWQTMLMYQRI